MNILPMIQSGLSGWTTRLALAAALLLPLATSAAQAGDYDSQGFEAPAFALGPVQGQGGWRQVNFGEESQPGDAVVQSQDVANGSQAVTLASVGRRVLIRRAIGQKTSFYLDAMVKLPPAEEIQSNPSFLFRGKDKDKKSALLLAVSFNGGGAVNDVPRSPINHYTAGTWTRVTLRIDLETSTWSLWINAQLAGESMPLQKNVQALQVDSLDIDWTSKANVAGQGVRVDQLKITTNNPLEITP